MCCRAAAQLLEVSWLTTVLKISGPLEGQRRFLPGCAGFPNLGGPQTRVKIAVQRCIFFLFSSTALDSTKDKGEKLAQELFPQLQGQEGAGGRAAWRLHFSSLFFRSLLNMQMLVIPKLPKKC